jgi:siroheme synthase
MTQTNPIHEIQAQRAERGTPAGHVLAAVICCLPTERDLTLLAQEWLDRSHQQEHLCALVSRAAQPGQQLRCTMLATHGDAEAVLAPSLLIVG